MHGLLSSKFDVTFSDVFTTISILTRSHVRCGFKVGMIDLDLSRFVRGESLEHRFGGKIDSVLWFLWIDGGWKAFDGFISAKADNERMSLSD